MSLALSLLFSRGVAAQERERIKTVVLKPDGAPLAAGFQFRLYVGRRFGDVLMATGHYKVVTGAGGEIRTTVAVPPGSIKLLHINEAGYYAAQVLEKGEPVRLAPLVRFYGELRTTARRPATYVKFFAHPPGDLPIVVHEGGVVDNGLRRFALYSGVHGAFVGRVPATRLTLRMPGWKAEVVVPAGGLKLKAGVLPPCDDPVPLQQKIPFDYRVKNSDGTPLSRHQFELGHWPLNGWLHGKPPDWTPVSELMAGEREPQMGVAHWCVIVRPKTRFTIGVPAGRAVQRLDARAKQPFVFQVRKESDFGRVRFKGGLGMIVIRPGTGPPPVFRAESIVIGPITGARAAMFSGTRGRHLIGGRRQEKWRRWAVAAPGWGFPPGAYSALAVNEQGKLLAATFSARAGTSIEVALK